MEGRRLFLKQVGLGTMMYSIGKMPLHAFVDDEDIVKITILHTNDVHSRIEPFPMDGSRNEGLGGASKRTEIINEIRLNEKNVLLFDAGDIFQGTPYFNMYKGELEMKLMSLMKYDAATMGNHDFDIGIEGFQTQLKHADFPIIVSNYDMRNTAMAGHYLEYKIFVKEQIKIGVFGLGIEPKGLIPDALCKGVIYQDPVEQALKTSAMLKHELGCHYVVCLSHLGYNYDNNKISDLSLAALSKDIDLIIGGHTHTFLKEATLVNNKIQSVVAVNQAGWAGIILGRLDVYFERNKKGKCVTCKNLSIK
jgi:5'-nucleotidase